MLVVTSRFAIISGYFVVLCVAAWMLMNVRTPRARWATHMIGGSASLWVILYTVLAVEVGAGVVHEWLVLISRLVHLPTIVTFLVLLVFISDAEKERTSHVDRIVRDVKGILEDA